MHARPFSLQKWYLDCVTDDGEIAILYCARLSWHGIELHLSSILSGTSGQFSTSSSVSRFQILPDSQTIAIGLPALGASGVWQSQGSPYERLVFENGEGSLTWNCLQPASTVRLHLRNRELTGWGYAERVSLSIPPWSLPLQELRWGRFVSSQATLVWIDWKGEYSTSFALHNSREVQLLAVSDAEVSTPQTRLQISPGTTLRSGRLGSTILPGMPALQKLLPKSLFNVEEHKFCSRGVLTASGLESTGWVIHETVHWNA